MKVVSWTIAPTCLSLFKKKFGVFFVVCVCDLVCASQLCVLWLSQPRHTLISEVALIVTPRDLYDDWTSMLLY